LTSPGIELGRWLRATLGHPNCQKWEWCCRECVWAGPTYPRSGSRGCSPPGGNAEVPLLAAQRWHGFSPPWLGRTVPEKDWSTETRVTEAPRF